MLKQLNSSTRKSGRIRRNEVYVCDFLEERIASQSLLADVNGLKFELNCDPDLCSYFDASLVTGIIDNVLVNAAKYTKDTIWPEGFDPEKAGAVLVEDQPSMSIKRALQTQSMSHKNALH